MKKKRMKKKRMKHYLDQLTQFVLAFAFAFLIYAMVWVEDNGALMRPSFSKQSEGAEAFVSSTTMSEELFSNEIIRMFQLDGSSYRKTITDATENRHYRPKTFNVHKDSFSVSKVTMLPEGSGLVVRMLAPTNFTTITLEGILNALATAGVRDAKIEVFSPYETSGENALAGVFPYFVHDEKSVERMDLAHSEVGWLIHLSNHYHIDIHTPKKINRALAQTKLSTEQKFQLSKRASIKKSLITNWEKNDLPPLRDSDLENLTSWLLDYQESPASTDRHTIRILKQIVDK